MLEYIQIYPETLDLIARYTEEERFRLIESMARYAFEGALPNWPETAPEWYIWPALRQAVDRMERRAERNAANASGQKRNVANASETKRNAANASETKRNAAKRSKTGDTDTETDTDIIDEEEEEEDDNLRARVREADDAWRAAFGRKTPPARIFRISSAAVGFGPGVIRKAITLAAISAETDPSAYALRLLADWQSERLTTLDDVEQYLYLRDAVGGKIPSVSPLDAQPELDRFRAERRSA